MARRGRRPKAEQHEGEDTVDTIEKDPVSPQHHQRVREAEALKKQQETNKVIEKFYEIRGDKLILVRQKANGNAYRSYVGRTKNPDIKEFVIKLQKEGRLKQRF